MTWMLFAGGSAVFAGLSAILAKAGVAHTPSHLATALRTVVVLASALAMVGIVGSAPGVLTLSPTTLGFLVLSGLATGASWLCYFRALHLGPVSRVATVDKSSIVVTVLFAIVLLGETESLAARLAGIGLITAGTFAMVDRGTWSAPRADGRGNWLAYAIGSAVFAALTAILGKVGIADVESNLGTAIRSVVVLVMAWVLVVATGEQRALRSVPRRELWFILLSGLATGGSWLCYWRAMQEGPASLVAPIDRLSILVTVAFGVLFYRERLGRRAVLGLALVVAGTLVMFL